MDKLKITAIIKTYNSEKTIADTLEALNSIDEIIAIDTHSKDDTIEFLKEYKAKIIYSNKGELQQGFTEAVKSSQNDWIIALCDDEIIPKKTLDEINSYILSDNKKKRNCISLDNRTFYFNKELKPLRKKAVKVFKKDCAELKNNYSFELLPKTKVHHLKNDNLILKYDKSSISNLLLNILEKNQLKLKLIKKKKASIFLAPLFTFLHFYFIKGLIFNGSIGLIYSINKTIDKYIFQLLIKEKFTEGENNDF